MTEHATFEPRQGLSHVRGLTMIMGDDDWRERGNHPDWCALENKDGERIYVYAKHTLHLTSVHQVPYD